MQHIAGLVGINTLTYPRIDKIWTVDTTSPSIVRDPNKCILCGRCIQVCSNIQTVNALTLLLAGVDLFMMMHPASVLTLRDVIRRLGSNGAKGASPARDWVCVRIS